MPLQTQQIKKYTVYMDGDGFRSYQRKDYLSRLQARLDEKSLESETGAIVDSLAPNELEQANFKLHVSFSSIQEYKEHKQHIKQILLGYLNKNVIYEFKFIEEDRVQEELELQKNQHALIKEMLEDQHLTEDNKGKYGRRYRDLFRQDIFYCRLETLDIMRENLEKQILSRERFLQSDQFTIYVPDNFAKERIVQLCEEIDEYLTNNNVAPAKSVSDVSSQVSSHINLRQEYLRCDFDRGEEKARVNAVDTSMKDPANNARRIAVKQEQENSDIYPHLLKRLLISRIDTHIVHLKTQSSAFFRKSTSNRIGALTQLKNDIAQNDHLTLQDINTSIENFETTYGKVIDLPISFFSTGPSTVEFACNLKL